MLKEGRDGRDASIKRIVSARGPGTGLRPSGQRVRPSGSAFSFLKNCKQPSYYTKFPASLQGAPAGPFAGTQAPATCDVRGAAPPREQVVRLGSCSPPMGAPPHAPGDFPVAGKVTKGAPRAAPFGIPRCVVAALFVLAYASRRATFRHNKRPICHFEMVGKSVLFFPLVSSREHSLFSIRGSAGVPPRMLEGFSSRNQYR